MSPWRLVGALGLFLVFEGFATLIAGIPASAQEAAEGTGGGLLGWLICGGLSAILGLPLTIIILLILAAISVMALAGVTLAEVNNRLAEFWRGIHDRTRGPEGEKISPRLPLGPEPYLRRWWRRVTAPRVQEPARPPLGLIELGRISAGHAQRRTRRAHSSPAVGSSARSRASSAGRPGSCRSWLRSWKTAAIRTSSRKTSASACRPSRTRSRVSACRCRWWRSTRGRRSRSSACAPAPSSAATARGKRRSSRCACRRSRRWRTTSRWPWPLRRSASRRRCPAATSWASKCPTCRFPWSRCAA